MLAKTVYSIMVLTVAFASSSLSAQPANNRSATDVCKLAMSHIQIDADRTRVETAFAQLPNTCLKNLYLWCSRESSKSLLGFGEAAYCSFGHEALLKNEFAGDFNALLAWWQAHRDDSVSDAR